MFGPYIRAALTIGVAVLAAAILQFIVPFFLPYLGPTDSMLYQSFSAVSANGLLIMLAAVAAGVLAAAVKRSRVAR